MILKNKNFLPSKQKKLSISRTFLAKRCADLLSCMRTWEKATLQKSRRNDKIP